MLHVYAKGDECDEMIGVYLCYNSWSWIFSRVEARGHTEQ